MTTLNTTKAAEEAHAGSPYIKSRGHILVVEQDGQEDKSLHRDTHEKYYDFIKMRHKTMYFSF